ncbi:L-seryl-tRNA(Sec) selenium transferase [Wohlfahrtiimonas chitiniclastica]|uniref:L-seryl-tRNA(Sec) selenium transferase n=1 Tax=Wohlfahrtiimonas chitiniclastica TaxID=400946 RepID=UPI001BCB5A90|nr:L-seryl-tRNA(Sec) selenium transferase [Wohlfahrtiimonas chitiniclastica]
MQLSNIIQVGKLLNHPQLIPYIETLSRPIVTEIVRRSIDDYKQTLIREQGNVDLDDLLAIILNELAIIAREKTQPVINATGILVHTNLGRAPIDRTLWDKAGETVCRYSNLEFNLLNGKRGSRMGMLSRVIRAYFGGEDNVVVNNNAAAIHLILKTFAIGKEVIVSRSEQVQIGGGFRIPEILAESGAILKDVGTTNITTLDDYLNAITDNTAMVLLVHQSNYYIEGFTEQVDPKALRDALPDHVMLVVDQGSGNQSPHLIGETTVSYYEKLGADLIAFSGDKMVGGPQAGIIIGKAQYIQKIQKHPMMRVFRPGKETYALLENLLLTQMNDKHSTVNRAAWTIAQPLNQHKALADKIAEQTHGRTRVIQTEYLVGGGTTPRATYPTYALAIDHPCSADELLAHLRAQTPPIIGVIQQGRVVIYPVSLLPSEYDYVAHTLAELKDEL